MKFIAMQRPNWLQLQVGIEKYNLTKKLCHNFLFFLKSYIKCGGSFFFLTFSSAVLLKKQRKASENWTPHGRLRKSAMQGHSNALLALASRDWKKHGSTSWFLFQFQKEA